LLYPGDFNGDGKPDVLARNTDTRCACTAGTALAAGWNARVYYKRGGSRHVRTKTVSRPFTICG
jgi:hypothetical protein